MLTLCLVACSHLPMKSRVSATQPAKAVVVGAGAPAADYPASLIGVSWNWLGNLSPAETLKNPVPARYTLELNGNGWFSIRTECGEGGGIFETSGARIVLVVLRPREVACPNPGWDKLFLDTLEGAGSYRLTHDRLFLDMRREPKTMVFYRKP